MERLSARSWKVRSDGPPAEQEPHRQREADGQAGRRLQRLCKYLSCAQEKHNVIIPVLPNSVQSCEVSDVQDDQLNRAPRIE